MKKPVKVTLLTVVALLGTLLLALVLVPVLFKDRIVERLSTELNERIDATVTFSAVDVSLLSTFPTLTAEVEGLAIRGKGDFEGVTLFSAKSMSAGIDLLVLVFSRAIEVQSVAVDQPEVHILVTRDGRANYDIVVEDTSAGSTEPTDPLAFAIEQYRISKGNITYDTPDLQIRVVDLNHLGRARVSGGTQRHSVETTAAAVTVKIGRVTYLKEAKSRILLDVGIDTEAQNLTLHELEILVNQLALVGSGGVAWAGEGTDLDLELASKKGLPIKALISAIPNAYAGDFAGLKANGEFSLAVAIAGQLGPGDSDIPSFTATVSVRDGAFKYPELPLGITNLQLDAKLAHPGGNLDKLRIDIPRYGITAGKSHANGHLEVRRPLSQPQIDLAAAGKIDLAEAVKAYPVDGVDALQGRVAADVQLKTKGERVEKLTGEVSATDVLYRPVGAPAIRIPNADIELSPENTKIKELQAQVADSDVSITGIMSPITVLFLGDQEVTASAWIRSKHLRVEDFLGSDEPSAEDASSAFLLPDGVDAALQFDVGELRYGDLVLQNFTGKGRIRHRKLTLDGVRANALGGSMRLDGVLSTPVDAVATFDVEYAVDKVRFADAFEALPSLRAYAPIARFLDGRFSTDFSAAGKLDEDLTPQLRSIDASGLAAALQTKLNTDFKPLAALNDAIPSIPKPLDIESVRTRFKIEDGVVELRPSTVQARGVALQVSGTHGLDQEMKYQVSSDVPLAKLTSKLAKEVQVLGLDLSKANTVAVRAMLTGSIQAPRVSVDLDTKALRGAVADAVSAQLEEQKARALQEASQQAERLIKEAEKRADQVRAEAAKAAERARKEGYARADQVEKEATGNPLKAIAAKEGAKRIRVETDKRTKQLTGEADKRADQMVAEARKRAAQVLSEAAKRSDQATESVEKQTDKAR